MLVTCQGSCVRYLQRVLFCNHAPCLFCVADLRSVWWIARRYVVSPPRTKSLPGCCILYTCMLLLFTYIRVV